MLRIEVLHQRDLEWASANRPFDDRHSYAIGGRDRVDVDGAGSAPVMGVLVSVVGWMVGLVPVGAIVGLVVYAEGRRCVCARAA